MATIVDKCDDYKHTISMEGKKVLFIYNMKSISTNIFSFRSKTKIKVHKVRKASFFLVAIYSLKISGYHYRRNCRCRSMKAGELTSFLSGVSFTAPIYPQTLTCGFIVSELSVLDPDFIRFNSAISPGKLDSYISCFSTRQDG